MRKKLFYLTIFTLLLNACGKNNTVKNDPVNCPPMTLPYAASGSICNTSQCQQYQSIWKELFMKLPVDQYLNKEQIQAFISQYHYLNKINPITKQEKLIYTSMEDAKSKLKGYLICPISFVLGPSDGHIMLRAKTSFGGTEVDSNIYFTKNEGQ